MKSLITFFVLIITFSFVNAQDLMRNGGFENFDHFEFWSANVSVTGASVEPVNTVSHSGNWSVEIKSGTLPVGGWTQLLQTLLTPLNNTDYKLVFWVKDSVTISNFLGVYGLNGTGEIALGMSLAKLCAGGATRFQIRSPNELAGERTERDGAGWSK